VAAERRSRNQMLVAMLTKLLMRFDPEQYRVHESAAGLARKNHAL
jgi:hypothetical protein